MIVFVWYYRKSMEKFMVSISASIFLLLQPADGSGWSLIPGIPNHYISASYAELVTDLANRVRTVAFIVAAVLLAASLAVNASGWLIKDLNIREVLRTGVLVVALLVLYSPSYGFLMSFGYNVGESIIAEKQVTRMVATTFRQMPN